MKFKFDVFAEQAIHLDFFGLKVISSITFDTRISFILSNGNL
ncbi:hypothetical protein [Microcystis aeruginosa]|nr:hypothetical protein [Microcystis aeruginosa]MDB9391677.1 hypothetical protein [Microcystis aeruginosa CS-579]